MDANNAKVVDMFDGSHAELDAGVVEALNRTQAVIEFNLDGTILRANDNFLTTMGYHHGEVNGRHH